MTNGALTLTGNTADLGVHALDSVRINRTLQACDKFYEVYGITENDGMWVDPEERVSIW